MPTGSITSKAGLISSKFHAERHAFMLFTAKSKYLKKNSMAMFAVKLSPTQSFFHAVFSHYDIKSPAVYVLMVENAIRRAYFGFQHM